MDTLLLFSIFVFLAVMISGIGLLLDKNKPNKPQQKTVSKSVTNDGGAEQKLDVLKKMIIKSTTNIHSSVNNPNPMLYKTHRHEVDEFDSLISSRKQDVLFTNRQNLTSWALHKQPGDITPSDYINYGAINAADTVIHRECGINKIVKGPDAGRILSDWEVDDYLKDDEDDFWEDDDDEEDDYFENDEEDEEDDW
jgi:hypothetical protein